MALLHNHKKVIYWADDDIEDMECFEEVLNNLAPEFELVQFGNGKLLLDHLESLKPPDYPSLIVLDLHMPVLDGIQTIIKLKEKGKYLFIPKVLFTTANSYKDKAFCDMMNAKMLTKPFTAAGLKEVMQTMLGYVNITV